MAIVKTIISGRATIHVHDDYYINKTKEDEDAIINEFSKTASIALVLAEKNRLKNVTA